MRMERIGNTGGQHHGQPALAQEVAISAVLRWGAVISAIIILIGIVLYVGQAGPRAVLFAPRGVPPGADTDPASLRAVLDAVIPPQPAAVTDLGLLLLIVTPVLSVAVSAAEFTRARDWMYVGFSTFVLAMLMVGFALGRT
jgi:uncharacterized membrane protein